MARLVSMVLKHKQCLLYARIAIKYGCFCGVSPNKCDKAEPPKVGFVHSAFAIEMMYSTVCTYTSDTGLPRHLLRDSQTMLRKAQRELHRIRTLQLALERREQRGHL